jgi:hypothetical protein
MFTTIFVIVEGVSLAMSAGANTAHFWATFYPTCINCILLLVFKISMAIGSDAKKLSVIINSGANLSIASCKNFQRYE